MSVLCFVSTPLVKEDGKDDQVVRSHCYKLWPDKIVKNALFWVANNLFLLKFVRYCLMMSLKQRKVKLLPRIKLKHNIIFICCWRLWTTPSNTYLLSIVDPPDRKHDRSVEWSFAIFTTFESNNQVDMWKRSLSPLFKDTIILKIHILWEAEFWCATF